MANTIAARVMIISYPVHAGGVPFVSAQKGFGGEYLTRLA
jgi:hypothetical protein